MQPSSPGRPRRSRFPPAKSRRWAGEGCHRQLCLHSTREQRVECSDRRRRVDRKHIRIGYAGLDPAQQVARLGHAIRDRREVRIARDDERVSAPQVAMAPGRRRSVELPNQPGDIRADAERRIREAAVRLGHPHDIRTLGKHRASVGRVLLHLVNLDAVGQQPVNKSVGLRIAALPGSKWDHVGFRILAHPEPVGGVWCLTTRRPRRVRDAAPVGLELVP